MTILFLAFGDSWIYYLQAYLSLPEGTASVIGLTAMMCDYYAMLVSLDFIFPFLVCWLYIAFEYKK